MNPLFTFYQQGKLEIIMNIVDRKNGCATLVSVQRFAISLSHGKFLSQYATSSTLPQKERVLGLA